MLRRKIESELLAWKNEPNHQPLIIKGIRQCGKTSSVLRFAEENYKNVAYINFLEHPEYAAIFYNNSDIDAIIMLMSALLNKKIEFKAKKTIIVLDEIQECPEARTALKFFAINGRFDVIATGSLLGVSGYGLNSRSVPVGYETTLVMRPLDFEEFLWANGISGDIIDFLAAHFREEKPVNSALHGKMRQLLLQYIVVGGMPAVVQNFLNNKDMGKVLRMQRDLIRSYEDDMVKYADKGDKSKIRECFQSIPRQLAKENKKFQYSVIKKGATAAKYDGSLQWLTDAGIVSLCHNLQTPELPLSGNAIANIFKVYMADTGLLVCMLDDGTQYDILSGNLKVYKGAVFENLIADILAKMGRKLYYFRKDSGLELDFLIRRDNKCVPIEVKSTTGKSKSLKTVLEMPDKYHIDTAIKLGDYNIGRKDNILTLPLYMAFLLRN